jgi:hypothetical protein
LLGAGLGGPELRHELAYGRRSLARGRFITRASEASALSGIIQVSVPIDTVEVAAAGMSPSLTGARALRRGVDGVLFTGAGFVA